MCITHFARDLSKIFNFFLGLGVIFFHILFSHKHEVCSFSELYNARMFSIFSNKDDEVGLPLCSLRSMELKNVGTSFHLLLRQWRQL